MICVILKGEYLADGTATRESDCINLFKYGFENYKSVKLLNEGDIVVYVRVESLVIHRVKRIRNGRVITRGDNCPVDDSEISVDNVVGVAVKRHINVFLRLLYCVKYFRKKKYKISQHIVTSIFKPVRSTYK